MISTGKFKEASYRVGSILGVACPLLTTLFGVVATYPVQDGFSKESPFIFQIYFFVQQNLLYLFSALLAFYLISFLLRRWGDPWALEKIQFILDGYKDKAFNSIYASSPKDHNRVTLFEFKRNVIFVKHWSRVWRFPWFTDKIPFMSNYLVPLLRSDHLSKKTNVSFHVPDSSDHAEGLAGYAWTSQSALKLEDLPSVGSSSPIRDIKAYAESTKCDEGMLRSYIDRQRPMPRAIAAIPVEKNGKRWGVVVLDSRYPDGISANAIEDYTLTVALIGHLLEKV